MYLLHFHLSTIFILTLFLICHSRIHFNFSNYRQFFLSSSFGCASCMAHGYIHWVPDSAPVCSLHRGSPTAHCGREGMRGRPGMGGAPRPGGWFPPGLLSRKDNFIYRITLKFRSGIGPISRSGMGVVISICEPVLEGNSLKPTKMCSLKNGLW